MGARLAGLADAGSPQGGDAGDGGPAGVGHHTQLGVLDGEDVIFVERLQAPRAVINFTRVAGWLPLHASSSGVVLLAHASPELQDQVLAGPLKAYTRHTITAPRRLRAFFLDVRTQGFAVCRGFIHEDAAGLDAPLRDRDNRVVAALSVIVPNDEQAREHQPALLAAARAVSRALGADTSG